MIYFNKKHFYILILTVFFIFTHEAYSSVYINEVQTLPTENRFVELYNDGNEDIDLTDWYIQRKTSTGSSFGSMITKTYFENKKIGANNYFVISKTQINNSDVVFDGLTLTDSNTIQLKNDEGGVVDILGWGDCESACAPNPTTGKSIQRISGEWVLSNPTPGSENNNEIIENSDNENYSSSDNVSSVSKTSSKNKEEVKIYPIVTKIILPKTVVANIPFILNHETTGKKKEEVILGRFVWNFGDGNLKEDKKSDPFYYSYQYEGEYVLTLSLYDSIFNEKPDSVDRVVIKVIPSGIKISSVGDINDPYIEIKNDSKYETVINDWEIKGLVNSFKIPYGMTILPGRTLKLSPKITGFDYNDLSSIYILDKGGQIFATYPTIKKYQNTNKVFNSIKNEEKTTEVKDEIKINPNSDSVNLNDLNASAGGIKDVNITPYVLLFVVITLGIFSVYMVGKNKKDDKEFNASDIKIIE